VIGLGLRNPRKKERKLSISFKLGVWPVNKQTNKQVLHVRCPECRKWIREKRAETASKNQFQNSPSGPKFKTVTAIVAWAMCEEWWTEARNADERSGMQARGTKQRELVEDTSRELPSIKSGSLVRDFWAAVEYGGIPGFHRQTQRSRARTNGKMGSRYLAGKKWKTKRSQLIINLDAVAVAMVVGIVSEMAAANECNR